MEYLDKFGEVLETAVFDGHAFLTRDGKILARKGNCDITEEEGRELVKIWLTTRGGRFTVAGVGYSILKSEPEQLAARNVSGKGAIVGGPTKEGKLGIAHVKPEAPAQLGPIAMVFCDLVWNAEKPLESAEEE